MWLALTTKLFNKKNFPICQYTFIKIYFQYVHVLQELEASIYSQRQMLLAEMESLKVREAEMKRQAELDKKMLAMERERVKMRGEQLAGCEMSLQQAASKKAQK